MEIVLCVMLMLNLASEYTRAETPKDKAESELRATKRRLK
jgi:hypothetical protein